MPQLLFKRQFFDAIRSGVKTTTLRRWKSCALYPGCRATTPGLGVLKIVDCRRVELEGLREADARADGFGSLAELREVLRRLYPDQKGDGKHWYKITFALASEAAGKKRRKATKMGVRSQKARLAERIRAELDKAVESNGSLFGV
ncbi:MAG: ASCH domain-containing protein [Tepidisphaeraceae bacterium]|jgi:hypothetical protein